MLSGRDGVEENRGKGCFADFEIFPEAGFLLLWWGLFIMKLQVNR